MKEWRKLITYLGFIIYVIALSYFLFFAEALDRNAVHDQYAYNLILFKEIKRFIKYRSYLGWKAVVLNLGGNIVAFMPFGFFLPKLTKAFENWIIIICFTFCFSLAIETVQLIYRVGIFDIDDIFLNTLGGILGYLCHRVYNKIVQKL